MGFFSKSNSTSENVVNNIATDSRAGAAEGSIALTGSSQLHQTQTNNVPDGMFEFLSNAMTSVADIAGSAVNGVAGVSNQSLGTLGAVSSGNAQIANVGSQIPREFYYLVAAVIIYKVVFK